MILIIVDNQSQISTDGYMPQVSEDAVFKRQQMITPVAFKMIPCVLAVKDERGRGKFGLIPLYCSHRLQAKGV